MNLKDKAFELSIIQLELDIQQINNQIEILENEINILKLDRAVKHSTIKKSNQILEMKLNKKALNKINPFGMIE